MTRGQLWETFDRAAEEVGGIDFVDSAWTRGQAMRRRRQTLTGAALLGAGIAAVALVLAALGGPTDGAIDRLPAGDPTRVGTTTDGVSIRTLAGKAGALESVDGNGQDARFSEITGIAVGPTGSLYVSEASRVRVVSPDGVVTTLALHDNAPPTGDVVDPLLGFRNLAVGPDNTVYVVDGRHAIRRITPDGTISAVARHFSLILGLTVDAAGTLYVADSGWLRSVTPDGRVSDVGACAQPTHTGACGELAVAPGGTIHFRTDSGYLVRTMTKDGRVTTVAGGSYATPEVVPSQAVDGVGAQARFGRMYGFALDSRDGTVYITDWIGLRKVTADGVVTTIGGSTGLVDDHGITLRVNPPRSGRQLGHIAIGSDGTMYAAAPGSILKIQGLSR